MRQNQDAAARSQHEHAAAAFRMRNHNSIVFPYMLFTLRQSYGVATDSA